MAVGGFVPEGGGGAVGREGGLRWEKAGKTVMVIAVKTVTEPTTEKARLKTILLVI